MKKTFLSRLGLGALLFSICWAAPLAAQDGAISGKVTNALNAGISDIAVYLYDLDQQIVGSTDTDGSGNYLLSGLAAANYKVFFQNAGLPYVSEFYDNKNDFNEANQVTVTGGVTTPDINARLDAGGSVSGRVTNAGGAGIENIQVGVYDAVDYSWLGSTNTDADGYYTVSELPAGNHKVRFKDAGGTYTTEFYDNKPTFVTADLVAVTAGGTTPNIDAQLTSGGTISGKVSDGADVGIPGILVYAYDLGHSFLAYGSTDSNGLYSVDGLPTGGCKIEFINNGTNYIPEWYNDKSGFATADQVDVTSGSITPNINAQLASGGRISGKVTNALAVGIKDIEVLVYTLAHENLWNGLTDNQGDYDAPGLPTGSYKVYFANNGLNYVDEWYDDKSDFDSSDPVAVTAGSPTANINAQLLGISLTLTSPNGGESWTVGTSHDITWTSTGTLGNVDILYSINGGSNWTSIVADTANDGSYSWTIPDTPATNCYVQVLEHADGSPYDSSNAAFTIAAVVESVSTPTTPSGSASGATGTSYAYSTGGSTTSLGHSVQYKFDWDDGSDSGWLDVGTTTASHSWATAGTYDVRAMARCATHPANESLWSATYPVIIYVGGGSTGNYNSPAQYKVLPEVIWAAATGGGTWMSNVQVTDVTGGSIVSVYYNTGTGRRGPFQLWDNNGGGALSSFKYGNLLETIDQLDAGTFAYYGTVGAVEFITQDGNHKVQAAARTLNGNYAKTFTAVSLHDANTVDTSRVMVVSNLTNNVNYRSTSGFFNPTTDSVTVEFTLLDGSGAQVGTQFSRTLAGHEFQAFNPFNQAGVSYPTYSYDNVILRIRPTAGAGKVACFGATVDNTTNDPAAHVAVQGEGNYDNGPNGQQILPEAIWASATGGGTWVSEVQIVDATGGSVVSVYFDYGSGSRRGPFTLWTGGAAGTKVKYTNLLETIDNLDTEVFAYYGKVGAVEFLTQEGSHAVQVTARTLNGNYSKTFPGLTLAASETATTSRAMLIQNYTNNVGYRSTSGFYNPTADSVTVEFTLLDGSGAQIGSKFSKTLAGYDFQAFNPFIQAGVPYPGSSYDNVILRISPTSGTGKVMCFGASVDNTSNDPASHLAVQEQ